LKHALITEISSNLQTCQGAAAVAERQIWSLLHCHPETFSPSDHHDLANIAENLAAKQRQLTSYMLVMESYRG
jgi:hypothetical protein